MKWVLRVVLLAGLIALGVWLWIVFFPSEEKVIRKNLTDLATAASSSSKSSLSRLGNAAQIAGYFSPDVEISFDISGEGHFDINGRDEIMALAVRTQDLPGGVKLAFPDINVKLNPDRISATVNVTVRAQQGNDRDFSVQEMKFLMKKINGKWLIIRVESVKTLSGLQFSAMMVA